MLASLGQSASLVPIPLLLGSLLDKAVATYDFRSVVAAGATIAAAHIVAGLLAMLARHLVLTADGQVIPTLRRALIEKLLGASRSHFIGLDVNRTQYVVAHDTERVGEIGVAAVDQLLPATLTGVALIVVMARLYPPLIVAMVGAVPLFYAFIRAIARRIARGTDEFRAAFASWNDGVARLLGEMTLTVMTGAEERERQRQARNIERLRKGTYRFYMTNNQSMVQQNIIAGVSAAMVLVIGGSGFGGRHLTAGQLLALYAGLSLLRNQWLLLARAIPTLINGNRALAEVAAILEADDTAPYAGARQIELQGRVRVDHITFRYTEEPVIHDVSLEIAPGERVALIGANGAGKTTIASLILGFYRPELGTILIDGHPLAELDLPHLRRQFGVVPQEPLLLPGTIAENIAGGIAGVGPADIEAAARVAGVADFVAALPNRYDTQVGDDGILLSGGQRQRIAVARALVRRPRFLILDEPSNHLDAETVHTMLRGLATLENRPAMLIISHDMEIVREADKVCVVHGGRIVATGPPHTVLGGHEGYAPALRNK